MKILKKAKINPVTCSVCGCVYKPSVKELKSFLSVVKVHAECPTCYKLNPVTFKTKEATDDGSELQ